MQENQPTLFAGTSGMVFTEPNKSSFPPEFQSKPRLTYYAHNFNSLEINSSFYKPPMPSTFEKWTRETPGSFQFTVKLWQGITHIPNLSYSPKDLQTFLSAANRLGTKKGCLLIQFPPSLKIDNIKKLDQLLHDIRTLHQETPRSTQPLTPQDRPWRLAVEFRHPSWYTPETWQTLRNHAAALVLHDMPASSIHTLPPGHPPFIYLRFHGPAGDYKGRYTRQTLEMHAQKIREWLTEGNDVYTYFNNTIGDAIRDCQTLRNICYLTSDNEYRT